MIFRRISHRIALQFTGFIFLLFMVNGALFLAADLGNAHRQTRFRLERMAEMIALRLEATARPDRTMALPPHLREQVRIADTEGNVLFSGALFTDVPFDASRTLSEMTVGEQEYTVLTDSFLQNGRRAGFVQVAEPERFPRGDQMGRVLLYLLVSTAVSALTYGVGLFFARRSLKPAEEMMERLEQFTQDASHELRTPLTAVGTSIDLALLTEDNRGHLLAAKDDLKQISLLVERLLALARLDQFALQAEPVDLTALVEEAIRNYRPAAKEKGVTIERTLEEAVSCRGDPSLLRQLVGNLLGNAVKFNKDRGRVRVRLDARALVVEDTGRGIAEAALPHVFDRFFQEEHSRSHGGGLGLGLALAKRIAELHGWRIGVKSKPGEGTTFTVTFAP